jgi:hypothetical protein
MQEANFFERIKVQMADAWKYLICPERPQYELTDLGPPVQCVEGLWFHRHDYTVRNASGHNMQCSYFQIREDGHPFDSSLCDDTYIDNTDSHIVDQFDRSQ